MSEILSQQSRENSEYKAPVDSGLKETKIGPQPDVVMETRAAVKNAFSEALSQGKKEQVTPQMEPVFGEAYARDVGKAMEGGDTYFQARGEQFLKDVYTQGSEPLAKTQADNAPEKAMEEKAAAEEVSKPVQAENKVQANAETHAGPNFSIAEKYKGYVEWGDSEKVKATSLLGRLKEKLTLAFSKKSTSESETMTSQERSEQRKLEKTAATEQENLQQKQQELEKRAVEQLNAPTDLVKQINEVAVNVEALMAVLKQPGAGKKEKLNKTTSEEQQSAKTRKPEEKNAEEKKNKTTTDKAQESTTEVKAEAKEAGNHLDKIFVADLSETMRENAEGKSEFTIDSALKAYDEYNLDSIDTGVERSPFTDLKNAAEDKVQLTAVQYNNISSVFEASAQYYQDLIDSLPAKSEDSEENSALDQMKSELNAVKSQLEGIGEMLKNTVEREKEDLAKTKANEFLKNFNDQLALGFKKRLQEGNMSDKEYSSLLRYMVVKSQPAKEKDKVMLNNGRNAVKAVGEYLKVRSNKR
ncbi:MAG TPA: hypothetical protein VEA59_01725 [Patescibacteria group bacterium]|nr:hypothetical protein [Patescibacteria group bacterium]